MQELRVTTERQSQLSTSRQRTRRRPRRDRTAVLVYVPHTTAGVTINEHADPAVARDFESAFERIVPGGLVVAARRGGRGERADPCPRLVHGPVGADPAPRRRRACARHLAGRLLLRVRRAARPHGLRLDSGLDGRGARPARRRCPVADRARGAPRPSPGPRGAGGRLRDGAAPVARHARRPRPRPGTGLLRGARLEDRCRA